MQELENLRAELEACVADAYGKEIVLVHGEGSPDARVMLIGEAPGAQEELLRRPFVGKAGKNLDEFLELAGLDRSALYVSNTVKLRPTKRSPAGNIVNRPPAKEEVILFLPWLLREIDLINPEIIVTLGNVPLKALLGTKAVIGELHGEFLPFGSRILFPMYHPASLIYTRSLRPVYEADIRKLAEHFKEN